MNTKWYPSFLCVAYKFLLCAFVFLVLAILLAFFSHAFLEMTNNTPFNSTTCVLYAKNLNLWATVKVAYKTIKLAFTKIHNHDEGLRLNQENQWTQPHHQERIQKLHPTPQDKHNDNSFLFWNKPQCKLNLLPFFRYKYFCKITIYNWK